MGIGEGGVDKVDRNGRIDFLVAVGPNFAAIIPLPKGDFGLLAGGAAGVSRRLTTGGWRAGRKYA